MTHSHKLVGLISAGGAGSRMLSDRPKPLTTILGSSLLTHNIRRLREFSVDPIYVSVHHGADEVISTVEKELGEPAPCRWIVEREPLGTIGALGQVEESAADVLAVNADLVTRIDLNAMLQRHHACSSSLTIAVHERDYRIEFGEIRATPEGRVTAYVEKPSKTYRVSSGTYILGPDARALATRGKPLGVNVLVERALAAGLSVNEFFHASPWVDVNTSDEIPVAKAILQAKPNP